MIQLTFSIGLEELLVSLFELLLIKVDLIFDAIDLSSSNWGNVCSVLSVVQTYCHSFPASLRDVDS